MMVKRNGRGGIPVRRRSGDSRMPSTGSKRLLVGLVGLTGDITGPWKRPRPNVGTGIRNQLTPRKDGDYHAWGFTKEDRRLQGFIQTIPSRDGKTNFGDSRRVKSVKHGTTNSENLG